MNTENKQQEQIICAPNKASTKEKCTKAFIKIGLSLIGLTDKIKAKFGYGAAIITAIIASGITLGAWYMNDFNGSYLDAFITCMEHLLDTITNCE